MSTDTTFADDRPARARAEADREVSFLAPIEKPKRLISAGSAVETIASSYSART